MRPLEPGSLGSSGSSGSSACRQAAGDDVSRRRHKIASDPNSLISVCKFAPPGRLCHLCPPLPVVLFPSCLASSPSPLSPLLHCYNLFLLLLFCACHLLIQVLEHFFSLSISLSLSSPPPDFFSAATPRWLVNTVGSSLTDGCRCFCCTLHLGCACVVCPG